MAAEPHPAVPTHPPDELDLAREGKLRLRTRSIAEVLDEIGPPAVDQADSGTVALQDIRDGRA